MKLSFNEATSLGCSDIEQDILLCAAAGFDYLEPRTDQILRYLQNHTVSELRSLFEKNRIRPHAVNAFYTYADLFSKKDSLEMSTEALKEFLAVCSLSAELGSGYIIIVPPMRNGNFTEHYEKTAEEAEEDILRILGRLSDLARDYGVSLALEPVGAPKSSLRSIGEALKIIKLLSRDNIGIAADAYNLYMNKMSNDYEELSCLPGHLLYAVHINSADDGPPSKDIRRFCGSGVVDTDLFLQAVRSTGYNGMVSIETFRPEYWNMKAENVIRQAYETTLNAMKDYLG